MPIAKKSLRLRAYYCVIHPSKLSQATQRAISKASTWINPHFSGAYTPTFSAAVTDGLPKWHLSSKLLRSQIRPSRAIKPIFSNRRTFSLESFHRHHQNARCALYGVLRNGPNSRIKTPSQGYLQCFLEVAALPIGPFGLHEPLNLGADTERANVVVLVRVNDFACGNSLGELA